MPFAVADRFRRLPPYLFAEIDKKKKAAVAAGRDVINLGIGDPDTPTPAVIVESLQKSALDPATHSYALDNGDPTFRMEISRFMKKRFGVKLDAESEIYPTIGSKEALANLAFAFVNPGDITLVPEPCYPVYRGATYFAGGLPVYMDLRPENDFFPDLDRVDPRDAARTKILWLNYPNSPTGKLATKAFFEKAIAFARKYGCLICQDAAYTEMAFDGRALSIFEVEGAMDVAIELHSCSKTFSMTGWRVGWACGNKELIAGLGRMKSNVDSGVFTAVQRAATTGLQHYDQIVPPLMEMYRQRRDTFCNGLKAIGWNVRPPEGTFYCWIPVPKGFTSAQVSARLLEEADIVTTPGNGFGAPGEGYIRATLTVPEGRLALAVERIKKLKW
jgi:LL-diaminopimelate aminotransferase